jgi:hypothetical protein
MNRAKIKKSIYAKAKRIEELRSEIRELRIRDMLLCDKHQRYYEKTVERKIRKSGKPIEIKNEVRGYVTWKEKFKDEDNGKFITIERHEIVRVDGEWLI